MSQATINGRSGSGSAEFLLHLVRGGVLAAGILGVISFAADQFSHEPVRFADTGATQMRVAKAEATSPISMPAAPAVLRAPSPVSSIKLSAEMQRVRDFVAPRYRVSKRALEPVLAAAEASGRRMGIDPLLIVAVMAIESSFNPAAESHMGAQGLMQVIPRFHMDKIGEGKDADALFDPLLNVRVGTEVLHEGLRRFGTLQAALQYYGGARSDPNARYANKVFAMKNRLMSAVGRVAGTGA
jgi:soluble lytic murein transglycosylase-like protein